MFSSGDLSGDRIAQILQSLPDAETASDFHFTDEQYLEFFGCDEDYPSDEDMFVPFYQDVNDEENLIKNID